MLDTNCYELSWDGVEGRALYPRIARANHDCAPNCRKVFFSSDRRMRVVAARDVDRGEELTLGYTPPLLSTPLRQVSDEEGR